MEKDDELIEEIHRERKDFGKILNSKDFRLEELENDRTRLIQCERFRGVLAPLILYLIEEKTREGFEMMNRSLKNECEKKNVQGLKQNAPLV